LNIRESAEKYERWLDAELGGELVRADIKKKHRRMCEDAFPFLRATYWRWAEKILKVCPDLRVAPEVLAVGDIHVENFGIWRDVEGRLVWGVNDFDEAAEMPYVIDLVRLAASAVLARVSGMDAPRIAARIIEGYRQGFVDRQPFVLDRGFGWLRRRFSVSEPGRAEFWKAFDPAANIDRKTPRGSFVRAIEKALPENDIALTYWRRSAGTGSLGRPRWVGHGMFRGAALLREAKAVVPSGWVRAQGGSARLRCAEIAGGRYRSPDPWFRLDGSVAVRRLSPNNRKLDLTEAGGGAKLVNDDMLHAMAADLAGIHLATAGKRDRAILADLNERSGGSFLAAVSRAVAFVEEEHEEWRKNCDVAGDAVAE
jgi:hypothetical protein